MRVLIAANNDIGLYKFRRELLEELLKENKVYIMLPKGEFVAEMERMGCHFIPCEFDRHGTNPAHDLELIALYKKTLREYHPDIVFTYTIKPNVYGGMACAALHIPYVANITGLGTAVENGGMMQRVTLTLYRRGLRRAQKVFFQNMENRNFFHSRNVLRVPCDLLPGSGVNLQQYHLMDYPDGETIDFIFVARIMKEKGIDQYLDAAEVLRAEYPNTRFHVCGFCEQAYEVRLKELQDKGIIIYHGSVKNMEEIYALAQCTVHPTYYPEGLSNVLLESAACGRPIITTNRSGCREVVDDGVNGFVVREKDSADLIEKLRCFLALTPAARRQMGLAGREKVERQFDRRIVVDKYMAEVAACKNR